MDFFKKEFWIVGVGHSDLDFLNVNILRGNYGFLIFFHIFYGVDLRVFEDRPIKIF